jgi:2,4-dienoyl-CoA reductase (NADPH2)
MAKRVASEGMRQPTGSPPLLFQPGYIGTLHLPHRILMGAMHLGIEGDRGCLLQIQAFYAERVHGGAALITTGGVAVLPEGGGDHMFCLTCPDHREDLCLIVDTVHREGGKIALQLFHAGRYARSYEIGCQPVAPSRVASRFTKEEPVEMTAEQIEATREAFVEGVTFARYAQFDAAEIMGSEGYLLNQFLSPITNRRLDDYGVDLAGRMRLSLEIVRAARGRVGSDYPLIFRLSGNDYMEGSTTREETLLVARELEEAGVDAISIGIGWHESSVPTVAAIVPEGAFAGIAGEIRGAVTIPVIGANRINTPETAERLLIQGYMDFVAPARPWLADPCFAEKIRKNDRSGLNICIGCNQACLDHTLGIPPRPVGCLVNPRTGHELEWARRKDVFASKRVVVIGGGVAGLEAAKTSAERGHHVTLFETADVLGGQFRLAARIPGKTYFLETIRYYAEVLERLRVEVRLGEAPSRRDLQLFDHVIVATGVQPLVPDSLPGTASPHVCTYADLLSGRVQIGQKIAIIGAGGIGCDVALYLGQTSKVSAEIARFDTDYSAQLGERIAREIHLISRSGKVAKGVGPTSRWVLLSELNRFKVQIHRGYEPIEIASEGVLVRHGQESLLISADQIVLCTGQRPRNNSYELPEDKASFDIIGGAAATARLDAVRAIREGYECALRL